MQLGGRFHWQAFHISGNDTNGDSFNDSHDDFRRARIEFRSEFLRYFDLRLNINLVGDNRFRGRDLDWGYENFDEANVTFDIRKSFAIGSLDTLKLRAGSLKHTLGSEAVESSNNLMTIERSAIANKIYGGSRPTGLIVDIGKNDWLLNLGLYSTEADSDFIGGFNDGFAYYAALNWKATDSWSFRIDGLVNRPDGGDNLFGYGWAGTFNVIYETASHGFQSSLVLGDNGPGFGPRGGGFHGVVIMPWYWIIEEKLQAVFQYQYSGADQAQGIRANARYLPASHDPLNTPLSSGRGDSLHTAYLGLNYHLCGNRLKIMTGVEYSDLATPLGKVDAITFVSAVRFRF